MLHQTKLHRRCTISSPNNSYNRSQNRGGRFVDQTRVNERIRAPRVRVIDGGSGQQLGVIPTPQAIRLAKERGLDLVEVAGTVDPPVCKIIDYGKYKYIQEKHKKEAHKHQKASKLKEMKFRIGIDPHDYLIKIIHAEDFLFDGHKVRIQLQFRGRQMAHQELGYELAKRIKTDLTAVGHPDMEPKMAGRNIIMQMSPHPERQRTRKFRVAERMDKMDHVPHADDVDHSDPHEDDHDDHPEAEAPPPPAAPSAEENKS